jgi:hypothetical protein
VRSVPGARAAGLVDVEGETVDYSGWTAPFDLRVSAAELRIVLHEIDALRSFASIRWLIVAATRGSYLVYALPDGYALVLLLVRGAGFSGWHRAVMTCAAELATEARWPVGPSRETPWVLVAVHVRADGRPRFVLVADRPHPLEILGRIVPDARPIAPGPTAMLAVGERGWRVRVPGEGSGFELNLVHAPGGNWYADEDLEQALAFVPRPKESVPNKPG